VNTVDELKEHLIAV